MRKGTPNPLKQKITRHIGEDRDIFRTLSNIYDEVLFEYSKVTGIKPLYLQLTVMLNIIVTLFLLKLYHRCLKQS